MKTKEFITISNAESLFLDAIPILSLNDFLHFVKKEKKAESRIISFFAAPAPSAVRLFLCLGNDKNKKCCLTSTLVGKSYPCLTSDFPQAQLFEREIYEQFHIEPEHHPWLKSVRKPNVDKWFQVRGDLFHEVAVGPVHAGVIEPGHFRFNCLGETVLHLEIALGYQHRGVEAALIGGPNTRTIHFMETLAGDTTIGHASAYCQAIESLSGTVVSDRALHLRAIALELERLANHTGDLGALANDIGFLPTASYCGRLRGDYLNMSAELCGSRFGRNFLVPGGVGFDCSAKQINELTHRLQTIYGETMQAVDLLWKATSILTRFERTGILSHKMCQDLGIVGLAARASGVRRDVRVDYPFGIYQTIPISLCTHNGGDVYARAYVRYLEIQKSYSLIQRLLHDLPDGPIHHEIGPLKPNSLVLSMTEGWRGEICHIAITNEQGRFARYKVTDPSFHNWMGLAMAVRDEQISNFPLCNKSFNLSYCGHDL